MHFPLGASLFTNAYRKKKASRLPKWISKSVRRHCHCLQHTEGHINDLCRSTPGILKKEEKYKLLFSSEDRESRGLAMQHQLPPQQTCMPSRPPTITMHAGLPVPNSWPWLVRSEMYFSSWFRSLASTVGCPWHPLSTSSRWVWLLSRMYRGSLLKSSMMYWAEKHPWEAQGHLSLGYRVTSWWPY